MSAMSPLAFAVLRHLSDGEFHSGETLAQTLQVSRTAIWQAVQAAAERGIVIHRIRGRGYRCASPVRLLNQHRLAARLEAVHVPIDVTVVDTVDSTSSALLRAAADEEIHRRALVAEWQSAGRGRLGRSWTGVLGGSLMFSLGWRFPAGAASLGGLSLVVGWAVQAGLASLGIEGIELKWPNDLVWRGHKLAGVLIEVQGDALGPSIAVIGIGLNVRLPAEARDGIMQPVVDLETICHKVPDRHEVLVALLTAIHRALEEFAEEGFKPFRARWDKLNAYAGATVVARLPSGSQIVGRAVGVAEDGALLLEHDGKRERLISGEIRLRLS